MVLWLILLAVCGSESAHFKGRVVRLWQRLVSSRAIARVGQKERRGKTIAAKAHGLDEIGGWRLQAASGPRRQRRQCVKGIMDTSQRF